MKLPPQLETQFNEYISKPQKSTDMIYTTQTSRNMIDALAKEAYGKTFAEMDTTIVTTIKHLYSEAKMSVNDIANVMRLEVDFITSVLKKYKLIKNK
jgi:hypothetical protein